MDFSRLDPRRTIIGGAAGILLIVSILFLPWFSLDHGPARGQPGGWLCGSGDYSCTGWETFPINRWLLLLAALSPFILGYILVRGNRLSWAPGEMTMVVGFVAIVLIAYNGIIDKPGNDFAEVGQSLEYGYWLALLAAIAITGVGFLRSEAGQERERKAPGTV